MGTRAIVSDGHSKRVCALRTEPELFWLSLARDFAEGQLGMGVKA